jgi:hypothetical protein
MSTDDLPGQDRVVPEVEPNIKIARMAMRKWLCHQTRPEGDGSQRIYTFEVNPNFFEKTKLRYREMQTTMSAKR